MTELLPCPCGEDINKSYRIKKLWQGNQSGEVVAVIYCSVCERAASYKFESAPMEEIREIAVKAWNDERDTRPETNKVLEAIGAFEEIQQRCNEATPRVSGYQTIVFDVHAMAIKAIQNMRKG